MDCTGLVGGEPCILEASHGIITHLCVTDSLFIMSITSAMTAMLEIKCASLYIIRTSMGPKPNRSSMSTFRFTTCALLIRPCVEDFYTSGWACCFFSV